MFRTPEEKRKIIMEEEEQIVFASHGGNLYKDDKALLRGKIKNNFDFEFVNRGIVYYENEIEIKRKSQIVDTIRFCISKEIVEYKELHKGDCIEMLAEYKSRNFDSHLLLHAAEKRVTKIPIRERKEDSNMIFLKGTVVKQPTFRKTPLGREITDLIIAVNFPNRKSSYIPCVTWEDEAKYAENFTIGTKVILSGRIQSRVYQNTHTAYEVSVKAILTSKDFWENM